MSGSNKYGTYKVKGIPIANKEVSRGNRYIVHSGTGVDDPNYGNTITHPFATIDYAIGKCTASQGDTIDVLAGHAETASTQITCDVAGLSIIGHGRGRNRPAITAHLSAVDCFNVSAANVYLENLRIIGVASDCTALINVSGSDFFAESCVIEPAATPLIACTLASGAARATFQKCKWLPSEAGIDVAIDIEATNVTDLTVQSCDFLFGNSSGCDLGVIRSDASSVENVLISDCRFLGCDTAWIDFDSSSKGLVEFCRIYASSSTTVEETHDLGGITPIENYVGVYNLAKSGARVPATSATP